MTNSISENRRISFEVLLWLLWSSGTLMKCAQTLISQIQILRGISDNLMIACYAIAILFAIRDFQVSAKDILFVLLIYAVFILECLTRGQNNPYLESYYFVFPLKTVIFYLVGVSFSQNERKEEIIRHLYIISMIALPLCMADKAIFGTPMDEIVSKFKGDMDLSYRLLPHCCLIAYYARKKPNFFNIVFTGISVLYLLLLGSRGPVLLLLICIGWSLIMDWNIKKIVSAVSILCIAAAAFVLSPLYRISVQWMYNMAKNLGLSIRIFDRLLSVGLLDSTGRDELAQELLVSIRQHPLLGTGIASDRMVIGEYAHNIVLELWVAFGVIIGTAIFAALIITFVRGYRLCATDAEKGLMITLLCSYFFKLFLSSSYMNEKFLFLLIGFCVGTIRIESKKNKKQKHISRCSN